MGSLARHDGDAYCQRLMRILRINFRDGYVEALPGLLDQTSADLPLILQGGGMRDMEVSFADNVYMIIS